MSGPLPRLIIHLGVQKTGTTSLQALLAGNADALLPRLAVHTPVRGTPTQKLGRAAMNFSLDPDAERERLLVAAIGRVRDEIWPKGRDCLISHENLPGRFWAMGKCGGCTRISAGSLILWTQALPRWCRNMCFIPARWRAGWRVCMLRW